MMCGRSTLCTARVLACDSRSKIMRGAVKKLRNQILQWIQNLVIGILCSFRSLVDNEFSYFFYVYVCIFNTPKVRRWWRPFLKEQNVIKGWKMPFQRQNRNTHLNELARRNEVDGELDSRIVATICFPCRLFEGSFSELAKNVCPSLHDSACWRSGEITQPRTHFFGPLCTQLRSYSFINKWGKFCVWRCLDAESYSHKRAVASSYLFSSVQLFWPVVLQLHQDFTHADCNNCAGVPSRIKTFLSDFGNGWLQYCIVVQFSGFSGTFWVWFAELRSNIFTQRCTLMCKIYESYVVIFPMWRLPAIQVSVSPTVEWQTFKQLKSLPAIVSPSVAFQRGQV